MKKKIKLKSTDFSNLHSKTVYDFCDDEEFLLNEFVIVGTKEEYLKKMSERPDINMAKFFELAELTNNNELTKAVFQQFEEEYAKIHNE